MMATLDEDALRAADWLCDWGFIDDHRTGEPGDAWLAGVVDTLRDAAERWPEMPAKTRRLLGPYFPRGGGHVRVEVLWVESKKGPVPSSLKLLHRHRGFRVCEI